MKNSRTDQRPAPACSGKRTSNRSLLFLCALAALAWCDLLFHGPVWQEASALAATNALTPVVRQADRVDISPPLRDIEPVTSPANFTAGGATREIPLRRRRRTGVTAAANTKEQAPFLDPAVQGFAPAPKTPAPTTAFEGISNADNIAINRFPVIPPDTVGDVGANHYVQAVNVLLKIFNKSGATLLGPVPIKTLFSGFGGPCEASEDGDPIVLYDHLADRWLISQFAFAGGPPYHQCIAISQTGDPTGAYHRYDFTMPNNKFNDYPKFGVWPDGYYMSDNQFDLSDNFVGVGVFAFERDKMLNGDAARYIYFDLDNRDPLIYSMLPADLDGLEPPPGTPNYFAYFTSDELGDPQGDGLRIFDFHVDFATPGNSTFTEHGGSPVVTASFNPLVCGSFFEFNCIAQRGTTRKLDALWDRLMFRLQYRNFGTHESLVTNHTVNAGAGKAGIRYYQSLHKYMH